MIKKQKKKKIKKKKKKKMAEKRVRLDVPTSTRRGGNDDDDASEQSMAEDATVVPPRDAHAHRLFQELLDGIGIKPRTTIYLFMWGKLHGFLHLSDDEVDKIYQANKKMAEEELLNGRSQQLELAKSDLTQLESTINMDALTEPQKRDIVNSLANMIIYVGIHGQLVADETHGLYKAITGKKNKLIFLQQIPVQPVRALVSGRVPTNGMRV
jgi:hypothetical protein